MGTFQPILLVRIFIHYTKFLAVCSGIGFIATYSGNKCIERGCGIVMCTDHMHGTPSGHWSHLVLLWRQALE